MRIAVNTRFLLKGNLEGLGIYTQEIFRRVVQTMPDHEFFFFFDRPYEKSFLFAKNVTPVVVPPPARHPLLWYAWFEYSVPRYLEKYQIDLFITPDGYASLRTAVPQILTVHYLGFEHYPEHVPFLARKYYQYFTPKFVRKATKIIAVSEYTKQDIIRLYQIAENKITVIHNGFDLDENELVQLSVENVMKTHQLKPKEYFIFIGAVHPRKNVLGILRAFSLFKQKTNSDFKLLLLGRNAWLNKELQKEIQNSKFKNDIVWITEMERGKLLRMLQLSYSLVFPSYFEGFGIPVLEAMQLSVPVITSNVSALPEVAGDAALLCDPSQPENISNEMVRLYTDKSLYDKLVVKGKDRGKEFTWEKSAAQFTTIILQELQKLK